MSEELTNKRTQYSSSQLRRIQYADLLAAGYQRVAEFGKRPDCSLFNPGQFIDVPLGEVFEKDGQCVVLFHPVKVGNNISRLNHLPDLADSLEAFKQFKAGNPQFENAKAFIPIGVFGKSFGFSRNHWISMTIEPRADKNQHEVKVHDSKGGIFAFGRFLRPYRLSDLKSAAGTLGSIRFQQRGYHHQPMTQTTNCGPHQTHYFRQFIATDPTSQTPQGSKGIEKLGWRIWWWPSILRRKAKQLFNRQQDKTSFNDLKQNQIPEEQGVAVPNSYGSMQAHLGGQESVMAFDDFDAVLGGSSEDEPPSHFPETDASGILNTP